MYGINIQVNGKQIEDLWQEWNARTREVEKLKRDNERMRAQLKECGKVIEELKKRVKELEGGLCNLAIADYVAMTERGKREMEKNSERSYVTF
jgi:predicted RNase H-like nuclease (RuvC/YqgF family)